MLNLDTHIVLFALTGSLSSREKHLLSKNEWSISAIVFWELAKLVQHKKIDLDLEDTDIVRRLSKFHVWPLDRLVSLQSTQLDFSSDPADEIIAATSLVYNVPLLTRDKKILRSKIVPLA